MKHCSQCGVKVSAVANFCENCGTRLNCHNRSTVASMTTVSVGMVDEAGDRRVFCDIADSEVTIIEDSPHDEIRLICPHASRFDYVVAGTYRIDCKLRETMFSTKKCGIFEGMRKHSK
jgi:zinc-ribbon domain